MLTDPLVACRSILLATEDVTDLVGQRVYATPRLPQAHTYPCIRLTHVGSSDYTPIGFRQAATAVVQLDAWAEDMTDLADIREAALDALHAPAPIEGVVHVAPTSEVVEIDESLQPPMYRLRADLAVRVVKRAGI